MTTRRIVINDYADLDKAARLERLKTGIGAWTIAAAAAEPYSSEHTHADHKIRELLDDALKLRDELIGDPTA